MEKRRCKGCNAPIAFVKNENGKIVPLDLRAPVYEIVTNMAGDTVARAVEGIHVSHFSTCPNANDFSAARKQPQPAAGQGGGG